ncbi:MAG TPA: hypothetical protein VMG14_08260 [Thermoplasmata archaeon]|jgi:hypothetical protein|nr:hypothetical protein [Thermoplasmata archaeon]
MDADADRSPVIRVDGRIVPRSAYRPSPFDEIGDTPAWWASLALLGGLLVGAGALLGASDGSATAIGGVVLFLATAVVAGAERAEFATALAVAGVVWTAAGISMATGVDGAPLASLVGFGVVGLMLVGLGGTGLARGRTPRPARG